jgi:hypothetical protein
MQMFAQEADVVLRGVDLVHVHPPFNAPIERRRFVDRKIVFRVGAQHDGDLS